MLLSQRRLGGYGLSIGMWQRDTPILAHADKWYYAYTIEDDTIVIHDACHQQNMHK